MAIPTKKMYDRKGKLVFDPNNPEDVRNYKEKQPLLEALKLVQGLTDPRGSSGFVGMARGISKAAGAKMAKSRYTKNKAKEVLDLVTKPMTKGKKSVPKTTPTVKEVVETKPTIPTTIPTTMELAQIPGTSVKTIKEGIKSFKGTKDKFTTRDTERVAKAREILNQPIAGNIRPSTITQGFKSPFANTSLRKYVPEANVPEANSYKDFNKFKLDGDVVNKPLLNLIEGTMIAGGLGMGSALISSGNRLSSKNNKQTKTPQKTGPVDLKRITNTKPSTIEGVRIVKGTDGKDYGIVWDNKTQSWDYYRGDKIKSDVTPIKDNQGSGTGGTTKPRSATGQSFDKAFAEARKQAGGAGGIFEWNGKKYGTALVGETVPKNRVEVGKTTTPIMGDEEYKKDPRLAVLRQEDDNRQLLARAEAQKKEMKEFKPTIPLSSLVFKATSESINKRNTMDEQNALQSIREDNKLPLKKKRYGGNLTMLKYMK